MDKVIPLAPHPRNNSLYVHIPFCRSKCRSCDFYSVPDPSREQMERLVKAELEGILWFREQLAIETIETAYVGGGTPSLLPEDLLETLFAAIAAANTAPFKEWTVEANPESLDHNFLSTCKGAGVTRLSVGVQSFDDGFLRFLGRPGTARDVRRALELLSTRWPRDVSLDLMTGLSGQTPAQALADVDQALAFSPGHISVYALTLEEGTPLHQAVVRGECRPLSQEREETMWDEVTHRLTQAGYRQYEVSNFCRPGKESLHNLRYWRLDPYIGIGPGAASTLPGADGRAWRLETVRGADRYCASRPDQYLSLESLSGRALLLEHLLMGLRLEDGIDRALFRRRFGFGLEEALGRVWFGWRERGLAAESERAYACTAPGRLVLNALLKEAAEEIEAMDDFAVNWP